MLMKTEQKNTTCIIRDTFIDMALCMEFLFVIHGANRLLEEDIVRCMEEKYEKAITNLKKSELRNPKVKRETPVDRFLKKLEKETI
jgi:hypothetical protein